MSEDMRLFDVVKDSFPKVAPDPVAWAHKERIVFPGSARSKHFNIEITPWLREPIMRAFDMATRVITFMKPVQSGGSTFGELMLLYWIMFGRGFLQYNWSNDKRAVERWDSRVEGILESNPIINELYQRSSRSKCEVNFGNVFFRMQGAFVSDNLDSDSVRLQINEEIHSWEPGHLKKARNRSTAVWDYKSIDVSNAGDVGDQLDQAYRDGTMQDWTVKCPGCGLFHVMRTKWEDRHPELGGLRYDADGCRLGNYEYNYNKLRPTIRFQMPCGFSVHNEDLTLRRQLSLSGQYSEPTNLGAELMHRSYTLQAVSVDFIDWMQIIKDKHDALRARALGDPEPWKRYKRERECIPYDPNDVPIIGLVTTQKGIKKCREGLPGQKLRLGALDRQQGNAKLGELPHWWLVLRDVQVTEDGRLRSRLVYEGKLETDEEVIAVLDDHSVQRHHVVADSGDDTTHVYLFCIRHGINAIKGGGEDFYSHERGVKRIFSPEKPLHSMINHPSKYPYVKMNVGGVDMMMPDPREPLFFLYSKPGIRERLHFLRTETIFETPEDVSEEYRSSMESEERMVERRPSDNSLYTKWVQLKDRNDQFVNECYIALQVDQAGMILVEVEKQKKKPEGFPIK